MKILVIGDAIHFEECRQKLGEHDYTHLIRQPEIEQMLEKNEVTFDFSMDWPAERVRIYVEKATTIFLNTCKVSLASLVHGLEGKPKSTLFGFNGLPTMFNREFLELSAFRSGDLPLLKKTCEKLGTAYLQVDDRVGLVTPRVICMIINEAYYTVQEGTASREDIDLAMKLGTNYPYGPFEWCGKIGLKNVYELLDAVYEDTRDERYKISALMRKEYLRITLPSPI